MTNADYTTPVIQTQPVDWDLTQAFLAALHEGGAWGYYWTAPAKVSTWWPVGDPAPVPAAPHVYFGVHPTAQDGGPGERSKIATIAAVNCLFAEFDEKQGATMETILQLAPVPSVLVHSGGGWHAYWLLSEPYLIRTDDDRERIKRIQAAWVAYTGGDPGAKDLARVLRLPGTYNGKYDPPRLVDYVWSDLTMRHDLADLAGLAIVDNKPAERPQNTPRTAQDGLRATNPEKLADYILRQAILRAPSGRNDTGFWLACQLRDNQFTQGEAEAILLDYASQVAGRGDHPYTEAEARASLREAYQAPAREPWTSQQIAGSNGNGYHACEADQMLTGPIDKLPNRGNDLSECPELPDYARVDPALGAGACQWLDDYIAFSRKWSPRAYEGLHDACGLFVLSTVAARRVHVHLSKPRHTNLMIGLTARTSLYAKSTTAEIALQTLQRAGLAWLLAADSATPQKFVADLTTKLIDNYHDLDDDQKRAARLRVGLAGQRGWYYDEFGQHVAAMMREGGFMADFRGLLRRMDDTPERYEYGTIGRGSDVIERPYLALLANMTPDDLRPFARRGSALWGDGFLARFALVTPPEGERRRERFPTGERIIPPELLTPLVKWHNRLGLPEVDVIDARDKDGDPTGSYRIEVTPRAPVTLDLAPDVYEAFYAYNDGLLDLLDKSDNHDLDGNYARLAEKALRVALLLASMADSPRIELSHWARAQAITEEWRAGLHRLYVQINQPPPTNDEENEEKLLHVIQRHGSMTANEAARFVRGVSSGQAAALLDGLVRAGELQAEKTKRGTMRYGFSQDTVDK